MTFAAELEVALDASAKACAALVDAYTRFEAIPDAPAGISTDADKQAQEIILGHLHALFPQDALCAEEKTPTLAKSPNTGPRLWIVDPIDGTRGFARKVGEFSVMIALVEQGEIAVGVVQEPIKMRLTWAVRGGGCWKRDGSAAGEPTRCRVTAISQLSSATLVQSHMHDPKKPSRRVQLLKPARVVETYSAGVKLATVARGEADIYVNTYAEVHDWDLCDGHILVTEAGGLVTKLDGTEIRYGLPGAMQAGGTLASNGRLHEEAVEKMRG